MQLTRLLPQPLQDPLLSKNEYDPVWVSLRADKEMRLRVAEQQAAHWQTKSLQALKQLSKLEARPQWHEWQRLHEVKLPSPQGVSLHCFVK